MNQKLRDALLPKQAEILEYNLVHKPRHVILEGAIRSGKTVLNTFLFLEHVNSFKNKGVKFIVTGNSIAAIKRNVLDEITRLFDIPTNLNQKNEFNLFGNTIICFGADKADSFKAMKGFTSYGWLGNEVTEQHINSIDQAFKRCSGKRARIFWDTNPAGPTHHIKTNFIDRSGCKLDDGADNIKSWHFILDDNIFLTKEYVQSIKESTPSGMWYERDINGMWVAAEGIIYTDFNYEKHVIGRDELSKDLKDFFAGQDWGFTHKGVLGVYGIDTMGTVYRILEIAESGKGPEWWKSETLKLYDKYGRFPVYCDPARADLIDDYRQSGIVAQKAENAVFEGISFIAEQYKKEGAIKIVREDNSNFIKEISGYRWADKISKEEPIKELDDSCDSDRYARYTHLAHSNVAIIRRWGDGEFDLDRFGQISDKRHYGVF